MQRVLEAHFSFQRTSDPLVPLPARGLFHPRQAHVGYRLMMTDHPENYLRISNALFAHCFVQIGPWGPKTHRCVAEETNKLTIRIQSQAYHKGACFREVYGKEIPPTIPSYCLANQRTIPILAPPLLRSVK